MMPVKSNMTPEEAKRFRRHVYENDKEGLIEFYKQSDYPKDGLKTFLVNSLMNFGHEEFLKEDGLI